MPRSKGQKQLSRFQRWIFNDGMIKLELEDAMDEFLRHPRNLQGARLDGVKALLHDWFLLTRTMTRAKATPLEYFLRLNPLRLKKSELAVYRRFLTERRFGLFRVEAAEPGTSLILKSRPEGREYRVLEETASAQARPGDYLIGGVVAFEDHWLLFSAAATFPADDSGRLERSLEEIGRKDPGEGLTHRQALDLFLTKTDWQTEGIDRVRARLAMLLQRWGAEDLTVESVEAGMRATIARGGIVNPLDKRVLERADSVQGAKEALELLTALWNLSLPARPPAAGPVERGILDRLRDEIGAEATAKFGLAPEEFRRWSRERVRAWLDLPQSELGGKTAREAISEERRSLGNPIQEVDFSFLPPTNLSQEEDGIKSAQEGAILLADGKTEEGMAALERACRLLRGHPQEKRALGQMALAAVRLGRREEAIGILRASLKLDPDYETARNNLRLLESMSEEEFQFRHEDGFFDKIAEVRPDSDR